MSQIILGTGSGAGSGDGEKGRNIILDINTMFTEVYALLAALGVAPGYIALNLTTPTINNLDPGGGFPTNIKFLDLTLTANDIDITGLIAGANTQIILVRNSVNSLYTPTLRNEDGRSAAANRFSGEGDAPIPPGGILMLPYYTSPSPRWAIG